MVIGWVALARGFWHAHMDWLFERVSTNTERFAPDLLDDRDIRVIDRLFPLWVTVSIGVPTALGGLITWSWWGALTAFFWPGLVRVSFLHHVTWSINSICHMIGNRPFTSRDKAANFWPLAILSMGGSWHNGAPIKEKVSFFGAAGLTVLVTTRQAATAAGIRLSTAAHTRRVLLPLRIIEMADGFDIYPDLPHALRRLGG